MKTPQLPLKWMTNTPPDDVYHVVTGRSTINSDILGNCYQEFISYGGGDGSGLVVVLAPEHATRLMAEMVDVHATDYLLEAILPGLLQSWWLVFAGCLGGSNRKPLVEC
jgi:restriction enzyme bgcI subunit alpha